MTPDDLRSYLDNAFVEGIKAKDKATPLVACPKCEEPLPPRELAERFAQRLAEIQVETVNTIMKRICRIIEE